MSINYLPQPDNTTWEKRLALTQYIDANIGAAVPDQVASALGVMVKNLRGFSAQLFRRFQTSEPPVGATRVFALNAILNQLNDRPILTVSDSPNASLQGVVINMSIKEGKVAFEANIASAKRNGLKLSSQLLRFASEVFQ